MEEAKKGAPTGQGPVSAEGNVFGKDSDILEISDESVIIYRSWFECLKEQGIKRFAQAMIALLSFAFYNVSVKSFHLPRQLESILETFTPVIETNRKKRKGGSKGADYGKKGGRPSRNADLKTPQGLSDRTPMVTDEESPKGPSYNVTDTVKVNVNETVSVNVTGKGISPPHTNFEFFIPVFFFRNCRHPEKQARKFVEHYIPTNWKLSGGELMATDQQRTALAQRWDIRDDSCDRFEPEDLAMWKELYDKAPNNIRTLMLSSSIKFHRNQEQASISGPLMISGWIEANLEIAKPIVGKWMRGRKYSYIVKEGQRVGG